MLPKAKQRFAITLDRSNALRMTCQQANCEAERIGWVMVLDVYGDEKHRKGAEFIEQDGGRRYFKATSDTALEWLDARGAASGITVTPRLRNLLAAAPRGMVVYLFPPGQPCFKPHLDREVGFIHQQGDAKRVHQRFEDYAEHWNEERYRVNRMLQKG